MNRRDLLRGCLALPVLRKFRPAPPPPADRFETFFVTYAQLVVTKPGSGALFMSLHTADPSDPSARATEEQAYTTFMV